MQRENNQKKVNSLWWLFLTIIIVYVFVMIITSLLDSKNISMSTGFSLILSELLILVPAMIFCIKGNLSFSKDLGFRKVTVRTVLIAILLGFFTMPVASFVNILSQFFVSNTMTQASDALTEGSPALLLLLSGVYGPVVEEVVFRGVFDTQFGKYATPMKAALVSSLAFGLMHLNVNQASYAFVLGMIFAIVNKASGSIITSMIIHMVINSVNMVMLVAAQAAMATQNQSLAATTEEMRTTSMLAVMAVVYFVLAVVFGILGSLLVYLIAKIEGRTAELKAMFVKADVAEEAAAVAEKTADGAEPEGSVASEEKIAEVDTIEADTIATVSEEVEVTDAVEEKEECGNQNVGKVKMLLNVPAIVAIGLCLFIIFALDSVLALLGL